MRIRIQTQTPLPELRAWFIPDVPDSPETIYELKEALCRRVQALHDGEYRGKDLILVLDDFELLDDSPFHAVRDGDLVRIKPATRLDKRDKPETSRPLQRKRKRSLSAQNTLVTERGRSLSKTKPAIPSSSKKKAVTPPEESESDTESDSSSSSSSTSSSSSSSSSSSTSSSSSSSSSSTSTSSPKVLSSKKLTLKSTGASLISQTDTRISSSITNVPPGYGKPSTHARNQRRKKRREILKLVGETPNPMTQPPSGTSDVNSLPLGPKKANKPKRTKGFLSTYDGDDDGAMSAVKSSADQEPVMSPENLVYMNPDQLMMGNLRNKNKKKGFKLSMANPIPQKIVFSEPLVGELGPAAEPSRETQMDVDVDADIDEPGPSTIIAKYQPRLIPPSEIQEQGGLPPNMFVTSVDVEAGMWDHGATTAASKSKSKRKNKKRETEMQEQEQDDWYDHGHEETQYFEADGDVTLSYGDDDDDEAGIPFDWEKAEKAWEKAKRVTETTSLNAGTIVGWKTLAIDPKTFTPAYILQAARVVLPSNPSTDSTDVRTLVICVKSRTSDNDAAVAFGLSGVSDGQNGEAEEDDIVPWADILSEEWRVLDI